MGEVEVVLSHYQAGRLLARRGNVGKVEVSPDLGRSHERATVEKRGVRFLNGIEITWGDLGETAADPNGCYVIDAEGAWRIQGYSEATDRAYSLMPTPRAPTLLVSGIPMHRVKGTDPYADTQEKIVALRPLKGRLLDTATGLGYTAIAAARYADYVVTIEFDPTVLEIAGENPWSRELFAHARIGQVIGDIARLVECFPPDCFDRILHDPPTFSLAGELYSGTFNRGLCRVLKDGGRLFHYVGNPDSPSGRGITRGVVERLAAAGFAEVAPAPRAFGVVAGK